MSERSGSVNTTSDLPRAHKAAILVQYLLREGKDLPLADLSEEVQLRLTRELGALRLVDRGKLDQIAKEFADELGNLAMTVPGSVEGALTLLDGRISPEAAQKLRAETAAKAGADPWKAVLALEDEPLVTLLKAESHEVGAVVLSKLPTGRAAALLGLLPGDLARRIAYAVSRTSDILPDAVARIGRALHDQYCSDAAPAFHQPPSARVGAILNSTASETRDRLLGELDAEDARFAEDVRKAIFTFLDIQARLVPTDIPKVIRDIPGEDLVAALAGAEAQGGPAADIAEFILSNMSKRMAESLREEMADLGKVKPSAAEAAQTAVVSAIRAAADAGEITLIDPEDED